MSLNKLNIPGIILAEMYQNELVLLREKRTTVTGEAVSEAVAEDIKEVLIVLEEALPGPAGEQSIGIISKILAACKWRMADTSIINITGAPVTWNQLKQQGIPRICILFGAAPQNIDLPVVFPEFRVHTLGETQFLYCPPPEQIEQDKLLKSKLWLCMKELFKV